MATGAGHSMGMLAFNVGTAAALHMSRNHLVRLLSQKYQPTISDGLGEEANNIEGGKGDS